MINKLFKSKKVKYIAIIVILATILLFGGIYALINWQSGDYNIAIKSSCMTINYTKGQDISGNLDIIDETSYVSNNTITMNSAMIFSSVSIGLDNACSDVEALATIEINIANLSSDLMLDGKNYAALKYVVAEYNPSTYPNLTMNALQGNLFTIVGKGNIVDTGVIDAYSLYLEHGQVKNYLIIFYVDDKLYPNPNVLHQSYFSGTIDSRAEQFIPTPITDFTYTTSGSNVTITKYNGSANKVNLAPTYTINNTTYNTVVNGTVFYGKTGVREVFFAPGITASSGNAQQMFYNCSNLRRVTGLPNNITTLESAFYGCSNLVNAPVIPTTVTSMSAAFRGCSKLINGPILGNSVGILSNTFYGCSKLVDAPDIPNSVTSMISTFSFCSSLVTAPTIPSSVTNIRSTFDSCTKLTGTIRINTTNATRTSGVAYNPFYRTSKPITVEIPSGSNTTYTSVNNNKPSNVTIERFDLGA